LTNSTGIKPIFSFAANAKNSKIRMESRIKALTRIPREIKYIFLLFLSTRFFLTVIGLISRKLINPLFSGGYPIPTKYHLLSIWGMWDSNWYLRLARDWYPATTDLTHQSNFGFFPIYPLLIRLLGSVIKDFYLSGLIVSNVLLITGAFFLYKLVRLNYNDETAMRSVKYLFLFPTAFIFSGIFSESLFLTLAIVCFYCAKRGKWLFSGVFGLFLSMTRVYGVLIIFPLLYEYAKANEFKPNRIKVDVLYFLLIPAGLLIFFFYCHYLTGNFFAFFHVKCNGWGHVLFNPLVNLKNGLSGTRITYPSTFPYFSLYLTITAIFALSFFIKRIGFSYWLFSMCLVFVPLASGSTGVFYSMLRYILPAFPLYVLIAEGTDDQKDDQIFTISFSMLQGFFMAIWVNGFQFII